MTQINILFLYLLILILTSCAQKPRSIIPSEKKSFNIITPKIRRLELPSPSGFKIIKENKNVILRWKALDESKIKKDLNANFIGYNVYRFRSEGFLKNIPLNKQILSATEFIDMDVREDLNYQYAIRCVFRNSNKIIEGPFSQILSK